MTTPDLPKTPLASGGPIPDCCDHSGGDAHGCWDCQSTGHTHDPSQPCPAGVAAATEHTNDTAQAYPPPGSTVTAADVLDLLPVGAVVMDHEGQRWESGPRKRDGRTMRARWSAGLGWAMSSARLAERGPLTVVSVPEPATPAPSDSATAGAVDGYCVCDGTLRARDCGIAAHRQEATTTPAETTGAVERAAEAIWPGRVTEPERIVARAALAAALFTGGWLQEVLIEHRDWRQRDSSPDDDWFVCRCGVELETSRRDVEPEYIAHVAERIRHAAGAGA